MTNIQVLNGPNVNLIGTHQLFGDTTLEQVDRRLIDLAKRHGYQLETFQSNAEHELIDQVQSSQRRGIVYVILNPGGLAYTSVALRDAFSAVEIPFIEVHLSNIFAREAFRSRSKFSDIAIGTICGLGAYGYELALTYILTMLGNGKSCGQWIRWRLCAPGHERDFGPVGQQKFVV